jgi:hypothetical protein
VHRPQIAKEPRQAAIIARMSPFSWLLETGEALSFSLPEWLLVASSCVALGVATCTCQLVYRRRQSRPLGAGSISLMGRRLDGAVDHDTENEI